MRLAEFILANTEPILAEWETFARSLLPGADMTIVALRDDAGSILRATARDMQNRQSVRQQASKSKGDGGAATDASERLDNASDLHGVERVGSGFHITDVVSEYRALRASVLRLWRESLPQPDVHDIDDFTRFDESLDQSLARGVGSYSKRIDESRQMFLAILSHDLRNPLSAIRMAAEVCLAGTPGSRHGRRDVDDQAEHRCDDAVDQRPDRLLVERSGPRNAAESRAGRFGRTLPRGDRLLSHHAHPGRVLRFHSDGDVNGVWDAGRIRQVLANLVGNAIQHGSPDGPIDLSVTSKGTGCRGTRRPKDRPWC